MREMEMNMNNRQERHQESRILTVKPELSNLSPGQKKAFWLMLGLWPAALALLLLAVVMSEYALNMNDVLQRILNTVLLFLGWRLFCTLSVEISGYILDHPQPKLSEMPFREWFGRAADLRKLKFRKEYLWYLLLFAGVSWCAGIFMGLAQPVAHEMPQFENGTERLIGTVLLAPVYFMADLVSALLLLCVSGFMISFFASLFMFPLTYKLLRDLVSLVANSQSPYDRVIYPSLQFSSFVAAELLVFSITLAGWMEFAKGTSPLLICFYCLLPMMICAFFLLVWSESVIFFSVGSARNQSGAETENAADRQQEFLLAPSEIRQKNLSSESGSDQELEEQIS